ncbi:hypothetical protein quinque_008856 [Culex quinquefasciatus]
MLSDLESETELTVSKDLTFIAVSELFSIFRTDFTSFGALPEKLQAWKWYRHCTDSQKKYFTDLFALAAEDETSSTVGRRSTSSRGRKPPATKKELSASNNSKKSVENTLASDDSTDEDWSKQKTGKRRKKAISDSE